MFLALGPNLLLKMMPPLFTKHHYIFEMLKIFVNNILLSLLPLEVLECL